MALVWSFRPCGLKLFQHLVRDSSPFIVGQPRGFTFKPVCIRRPWLRADTIRKMRLIGLVVYFAPVPHENVQFLFGQFAHPHQHSGLLTALGWIEVLFVYPPFFRTVTGRCFMGHQCSTVPKPPFPRNRAILPWSGIVVLWCFPPPQYQSSSPKVLIPASHACRASRSTASNGCDLNWPSRPVTVMPSLLIASRASRARMWASSAVAKT